MNHFEETKREILKALGDRCDQRSDKWHRYYLAHQHLSDVARAVVTTIQGLRKMSNLIPENEVNEFAKDIADKVQNWWAVDALDDDEMPHDEF